MKTFIYEFLIEPQSRQPFACLHISYFKQALNLPTPKQELNKQIAQTKGMNSHVDASIIEAIVF